MDEKMIKKIEETELFGNWFDHEFPESLELFLDEIDLPLGSEIELGSDGDYYIEYIDDETKELEKVYFNFTWYKIFAQKCSCSKFISVISKYIDEFYSNTTTFCLYCGRDYWRDGTYEYEKIEDLKDLQSYIDRGYELSDEGKEIIEEIYPMSFENFTLTSSSEMEE